MFATAYRSIDDPNIVFILTPDGDNAKEILAMCHDYAHIPVMHNIGEYTDRYGHEYTIWQTEYSETISKKHGDLFNIYKALVQIENKAKEGIIWYKFDWSYAYRVSEYIVDLAKEDSRIPESVAESLERISTWASAYGGNYMFEFKRSAIAVDSNGAIVLRDVVFFVDQ